MPRNHHPLAESVDARRWDAEAPLGRIVLVAHAAFLHAGFVSCAGKQASLRPVPKQVGLTASTLPLRYTIPELVAPSARRDDAPAAAAAATILRLCAHGDLLILYGYLASGGRRPRARWACIDARLVAPALSGDLDAAARALAGGDALGARIWNALADGLARRLFLDIWAANAALLPPRLTALPDDLQAAILGRLAGVDLAMVECTCTGMRDLVVARELWRCLAERQGWRLLLFERSEIDESSRGWKEKYVATRWGRWPPWARWRHRLHSLRWLVGDFRLLCLEDLQYECARRIAQCELDRSKGQDPTKHLIRRFLQRKSKVPIGDGDGHRRRTTAVYGNGQRWCREEAIYSPSARYGWTHR